MAATTCACGYNLPEGIAHCPSCGRDVPAAGSGATADPAGPPGGWDSGPPPAPDPWAPPAGAGWAPPGPGQAWGPPPGGAQSWGPAPAWGPPAGQGWAPGAPGWGPPPGGPGWPGPGGGPAWAPARPSSPGRGLAIAALVLGIASLVVSFVFVIGLVAIVLGLIAFTQARGVAGATRRMAVAGATLGVISLVIGVIALSALVHVARTYRTFATLSTGQCFNTVHGVLPHYSVVGCSHPHDGEAYGIVRALEPAGTPYPGTDGFAVDQAQCRPLSLAYAGGALDPTRYRAIALVPDTLAWDRGVRRLVCVVQSASGGKLIGSVRGSAAGGPAA